MHARSGLLVMHILHVAMMHARSVALDRKASHQGSLPLQPEDLQEMLESAPFSVLQSASDIIVRKSRLMTPFTIRLDTALEWRAQARRLLGDRSKRQFACLTVLAVKAWLLGVQKDCTSTEGPRCITIVSSSIP